MVLGQLPHCDVGFGDKERPLMLCIKPFPTYAPQEDGSAKINEVSNYFLLGSVPSMVHIDPTSGHTFVRRYPIAPTTCHYYLVLYLEDVQLETGIPGS